MIEHLTKEKQVSLTSKMVMPGPYLYFTAPHHNSRDKPVAAPGADLFNSFKASLVGSIVFGMSRIFKQVKVQKASKIFRICKGR